MRRREFIGLISGAVAWPHAARAQNARMPVIGLLSSTGLPEAQMSAFRSGLSETGYVEGRNMTILLHSADGDFDRLPALAADLVSRQVAVIVAMNSPVPARVAKAATSTIPIVFAYGGDPIVDNLVSNFSRPEANVTGTTFISATLSAKRLEYGSNMTILLHSADGDFDRLPALAADLVSRQVAVIVAMNSPVPARVAKAATSTIPIVFAYGGDPIVDNLVSNFSRPEANVTGTTFISATLSAKRLELLNEIVPGLTDIALLVNPKATLAESQIRDTQAAMQKTGQRLHVLNASSAGEVESAFAEIGSSNAKALLVGIDPTLGFVFRDQIIGLAARYKMPTMHGSVAAVRAGGLIGYGADSALTWHQAGVYAGRILKGEKPADLPIIQPTKFELVVNLKPAKALGLTIPESFLIRADEVIE